MSILLFCVFLLSVSAKVCLNGQNQSGYVCFNLINRMAIPGTVCIRLVMPTGEPCSFCSTCTCTSFEIVATLNDNNNWSLESSYTAISNKPFSNPILYPYNCSIKPPLHKKRCTTLVSFKSVYGNYNLKNLCSSPIYLSVYANIFQETINDTALIENNQQILTAMCDKPCKPPTPPPVVNLCHDAYGFTEGFSTCFNVINPILPGIGGTSGPLTLDLEYQEPMYYNFDNCQSGFVIGDSTYTASSTQLNVVMTIGSGSEYYIRNSSIYIGNASFPIPVINGVPTIDPTKFTYQQIYSYPYPYTAAYNIPTVMKEGFFAIMYVNVCEIPL